MIVRLSGVKRVKAKGRIYYYHRKTNTRLPDDARSSEFIIKLRALDAKYGEVTSPGTLGGLIKRYKAGPEWENLAPNTHVIYNKALDYLKPLDGMPLVQINSEFVYALRDKTVRTHKRSFTNKVLQVLQLMWNWGKRRGLCEGDNPILNVDRIRKPRGAPVKNRPWTGIELETVLEAAEKGLRVAIALGAYTGLRESDVACAAWSCYDGKAIETRQSKTGNPVWIPAHYKLREILDNTPRVSPVIVTSGKNPHSVRRSVRASVVTAGKWLGAACQRGRAPVK